MLPVKSEICSDASDCIGKLYRKCLFDFVVG